MTKTYAQLTQEIKSLQAQAEQLRLSEVAEVIGKIKVAIAHYGFTARDLGLAGRQAPQSTKATAKSRGKTPRYSDGQGNSWTGRGPRPRWIKESIAAGRTLESFESSSAGESAPPRTKAPKPDKKVKSLLPVKFRDASGNTWSGRGSTPRWLTSALSGGKVLSDFAV